ncbi:hypothetical protein AB0I87_32265 [Streptomyces sp. NPDC049952]|uniref:hypothetical protein n=1 Tax=Streptomyces TaxID=1883 RepID=UPI00068F716D|nr:MULTISPECIES: hypothetical protein [unclassified Streptomyces]MDX2622905.1 hypothetical protein [Streptomyces sp. WI03-5b]MEE1774648.1 hypothetical protein [Streptomyces sp. JV181]
MRIGSLIGSAEERLLRLRGAQSGPTAEVQLLQGLGRSAGLVEAAWERTAVAAVSGGVSLQEVARWADMFPEALRGMLSAGAQEDHG